MVEEGGVDVLLVEDFDPRVMRPGETNWLFV